MKCKKCDNRVKIYLSGICGPCFDESPLYDRGLIKKAQRKRERKADKLMDDEDKKREGIANRKPKIYVPHPISARN